jgi:hypothetical protein
MLVIFWAEIQSSSSWIYVWNVTGFCAWDSSESVLEWALKLLIFCKICNICENPLLCDTLLRKTSIGAVRIQFFWQCKLIGNAVQKCGWFINTRWFKYDREKLWLVYTQIVPVIFEPPCTSVNYLFILVRLALNIFLWLSKGRPYIRQHQVNGIM